MFSPNYESIKELKTGYKWEGDEVDANLCVQMLK
jgi:hypothetical protein